MPGPNPKPAATRQRANRAATRASLPSEEAARKAARSRGKPPALPNRGPRKPWHPRTRAWWKEVWESPMAGEFLRVHHDGLLALAELIDARNKLDAGDPMRLKLEAEIRMQRRDFGLTPMDMRRLQWEVEKGEEAEEKRAERRQRQTAKKAREEAADPRDILKAVPKTA